MRTKKALAVLTIGLCAFCANEAWRHGTMSGDLVHRISGANPIYYTVTDFDTREDGTIIEYTFTDFEWVHICEELKEECQNEN